MLRLSETAKFHTDLEVPVGSTNLRSAGWFVTSQSSKSLSQSSNEA
jgi:hypothetical protein